MPIQTSSPVASLSGVDERPPETAANVTPALTIIALLVSIAAAAGTALWPGVLTGPAAMNGSARGTAVVILGAAAPLVTLTLVLRRKSISTLAVSAGGLAYLAYNGFLFLFGTPFNRLFLVYVAMASCASWALGYLVRHLLAFTGPVTGGGSRPVAAYLGVVVIANTVLWLKGVLLAVFSDRPAVATDGMGLATNPVWVQDLAFWLPASLLVAIALWRGRPWSRPLGIALLTFWFLESLSVGVDQWMGASADPASPVVSTALVPGFFMLAALTLVPLGVLFRRPGHHS